MYDRCRLCRWYDDGQDAPDVDAAWGGPNGRYSLTRARTNFRRHGSTYDADDPLGEPYSAREVEARGEMAAAFDGMREDLPIAAYEALWERVRASERVLAEELNKQACDWRWQEARMEKVRAQRERMRDTQRARGRRRRHDPHRDRADAAWAKCRGGREPR